MSEPLRWSQYDYKAGRNRRPLPWGEPLTKGRKALIETVETIKTPLRDALFPVRQASEGPAALRHASCRRRSPCGPAAR